MNYLNADETSFRNRDVFEIKHVPELFNHRESQLKDIAFALKPGLKGARPLNTVLRGIPGTGKTTAVRRIFAEVQDTTTRLVPVYMNCQTENSKYSVFAKVYQKLIGHQPPPTGIPLRRVITEVAQNIEEKNLVAIVCLDDANYLLGNNVLNDTLYSLMRLHEVSPDAMAGVILPISCMHTDLVKTLDPCVISVLQATDVYFPPYTSEEIREILLQRIKIGVYPGVISVSMLDLIVEQTMKSGDLRVGLDLVKRSIMGAERVGRTAVEEEDVLKAYEDSKYIHLVSSVNTLNLTDRKMLCILAQFARTYDQPLTSGEAYGMVCDNMKMSYSGFHERIRKFCDMQLIDTVLRHFENGGRTREIVFRYDVERVAEACG